MIATALLFACLTILAYAWIAYPLLLMAMTSGRDVSHVRQEIAVGPVSVVLSAFNEEGAIAQRLDNLVQIGGEHEIWIGTDGCTDRTAAIAKEYAARHPNIHVAEFTDRRGKVAVLKDLVRRCTFEVLVMTDANTVFRPDTIRKLSAYLADPKIGGVCGRLIFTGAASPESVYWRWENRLKSAESEMDSCLGANGAVYAIRRNLFWHNIPNNTIVDDLVIGLKVREQGSRFVYAADAIAEEELPSVADEWARRVRIGAGDYQALVLCRSCLSPAYRCFSCMFWSHKVLRWFTPHMLLLAAVASFFGALAGAQEYIDTGDLSDRFVVSSAAVLAIVLGLVTAMAGRIVRDVGENRGIVLRAFQMADHFLSMQLALLFGFVRFCRGRLAGHWDRTPRKAGGDRQNTQRPTPDIQHGEESGGRNIE